MYIYAPSNQIPRKLIAEATIERARAGRNRKKKKSNQAIWIKSSYMTNYK